MLYCSKCRGIAPDATVKCPNCHNTKLRQVNGEDYVLLHRADQYTAERLTKQFDEMGINYLSEPFGKGRVSYLYDSQVMPTDRNIYVIYRDYPAAQGLSANLKDTMEQEQTGDEEEFEDMPRRKRMLVQALSAIAFMIVVMLVVFSADAIAEWLRSLLF